MIPMLVLYSLYSKMTAATTLTQDRKNALEEYVYNTRGEVDDHHTSYGRKRGSLSAPSQAEGRL